ncbi:MAG TPA: SAM-dependent methyltransferase [Anaerolineae bacterium]|nr:SAM-dependent methyltransferase [Anaerolineae bacterium]
MFSNSAKYYDELYSALGKDYLAEVKKTRLFIQKHKKSTGDSLLDAACGTGIHAGYLNRYYQVEGLDIDSKMLSIARKKHPGIRFTKGDMISFDLSRQFHIVTCLFSSIGYVRTKTNLRKAIKTMSNHLLPGGVLLVEPWFTPEQWNPGRVFTLQVDKPDLKIIRMSHSGQRGKKSIINFQYLVGTPNGITHSSEQHVLGLFTHEEYLDAFHSAGLKVTHDKKGLAGRGLYIGREKS